MGIKILEVLPTDSLYGSRFILNDNFSKIANEFDKIESVVDFNEKSIICNTIDNTSNNANLVLKTTGTTSNDETELTLGNDSIASNKMIVAPNYKVGNLTLEEYIDNILKDRTNEITDTIVQQLSQFFLTNEN